MDKKQAKVGTVMREFKEGKLKSSSGKKVTNPKQAIAIGLSEAGLSKKMKEGGMMKDSKAMAKKEIAFMEKKGAPKSMIKHEKAEYGMKKGGKTYAKGGMAECKTVAKKEVKAHEKRMHGMARGGGIEIKGKTKGKMITMKKGGYC